MSTWVPRSIRVTDFMTPTATMQFRAFIQDKPGSSNILEAGLDHWKVTDIAIGIGEQNVTSFSVFPNPFSKTSMAPHNCRRCCQAEIVITGLALVAVHAAIGVPTDAYSLTDMQSLGVIPCRHDPAHCLVSWYHRISG